MGKGWKVAGMLEKAAQKGKIFTKLAREISVAARLGGPDPDNNSRLKLAIAAAKQVSCPKDTIERAIKKGSGQLEDGQQIEEVLYEGMGPYGVGFILECQTDNKNRTVGDIRNIFKRYNGSLGESGSVVWMFDRQAFVIGEKTGSFDPDEEAIEVSANEVEKNDDGSYSFFGDFKDLDLIRTNLMERGWDIKAAEPTYRPKNFIELYGEAKNEILELYKALDENDDTQKIFHNLKD